MSGSLALVGSGEYLPAMAEFEKSLITDGIKNGRENTYIQIPTAAGQESQSRLKYWQDLGKAQGDLIGCKVIYLPIYNREDANNLEYVDKVKNSALIYMSGGDPHYLASTLINTPLWSVILESWQGGSSLAGCSAGAMVLSSHIPNFRLSKSEPTPGLNLIPNIRVIPHFNKFFKWIPESAAKLLMHVPDDCVLIGIDELTAIVMRSNTDYWQVNGKAKIHFLKGIDPQQLIDGEIIRLNR
ncbi:MAG: peptidase [Actinobacteria bacterium]|jgi:cyanophycinase-like exopeptidase|nr:peptidase [Actinomycetota bacterium]